MRPAEARTRRKRILDKQRQLQSGTRPPRQGHGLDIPALFERNLRPFNLLAFRPFRLTCTSAFSGIMVASLYHGCCGGMLIGHRLAEGSPTSTLLLNPLAWFCPVLVATAIYLGTFAGILFLPCVLLFSCRDHSLPCGKPKTRRTGSSSF
jgi:hypothetical protein